jgi:hypothetical protein
MTSRSCNLLQCGLLALLLGGVGCSRTPPAPPADQFKTVSDGKKAQLKQFLESKQSRLVDYKATVTEEPNIDRRGEHTHVGVIEFAYPVTRPEGEHKSQTLNTASAEYVFSTTEKKWVYRGCFLKQGGGFLEPKDGLLVTFPEVKAAFEQ